MIDADHVRTMARYNRWQNRSLYAAADEIGEAARRLDRGAFFGSIHRTLSHLFWSDRMWMSRFDGGTKPDGPLEASPDWIADWTDLAARRAEADEAILAWAGALTDAGTTGRLSWYSGLLGRDTEADRALCLAHFFNHQTHHRGQVHAMLTAAGARPEGTDLFTMPADA